MKQVFFIFLLFIFVKSSLANDDQWIENVIHLTINNKFDSALTLIDMKLSKNPKDYKAQFYLAATLSSKMTYYENDESLSRFQQAIDSTILTVEEIIETDDYSSEKHLADLLFYIGSAYGYRSFYQGNHGQWLSAISNALRSVSYLSEALEKDSTMYGAYLGIGVYKYWRYSRLKVVSWLPFVPDDRDEGIQMILYAITHDPVSRYMAMHQLIYILLDYGKMEEALFFAEKAIRKYPESQFMYWAFAHACLKNKLYEKATDAYQRLKNLIVNDDKSNFSHLIRCEYKLALIEFELHNYSACVEKCNRIFALSEDTPLTENGQETISQTKDLLEKCESNDIN